MSKALATTTLATSALFAFIATASAAGTASTGHPDAAMLFCRALAAWLATGIAALWYCHATHQK